MFQVVAGPVLLAAGLVIIFLAIHGMPANLSLPRLSLRRGGRSIPPGDALVVEMLSEMLNLREQLAELREQIGSKKPRARKTKAA
jgi:hypothetical protein